MKKKIIIIILTAIGIFLLAFFYFQRNQNSSTAPESEFSEITNIQGIEENTHSVEEAGFTWQNNLTPLEDLLPNKDGATLKKVLDSVYKDQYKLFSCNNGMNSGIVLVAKSNPENVTDPYLETKENILAWEPFIASDLSSILFPETSIPSSVQSLFEDIGIDKRKASFTINSETRSIYYGLVINYIAFTTSEQCLMAALNSIYPIE